MVLHILKCKREVCNCLRVPHPHRPTSYPLCERNPMSDVLQALLMGVSDEEALDIAVEIALTKPGRAAVACPF